METLVKPTFWVMVARGLTGGKVTCACRFKEMKVKKKKAKRVEMVKRWSIKDLG